MFIGAPSIHLAGRPRFELQESNGTVWLSLRDTVDDSPIAGVYMFFDPVDARLIKEAADAFNAIIQGANSAPADLREVA